MTEKKKISWLDYILIALIAVCLVLAFVPRTSKLEVFVPGKERTYGSDDRILSVEGNFQGERKEGKSGKTVADDESINLDIPRKTEDDDSLTIVSTNKNIAIYYYWGVQFMKYYPADDLEGYSSISFTHPNDSFEDDMSLSDAIKKYSEQGYMLIFSVKGGSRTGWDQEDEETLRSLDVQVTPYNGNNSDSYAAWVYNGQTYSDCQEESITHYEQVNGHRFYITSAGAYAGNRSSIMIDGKETSANSNGMNLVVYDPEDGKLIDSLSFNTNTANVSMTREDDLFYTEYTRVLNGSFLELIDVRAHMCAVCWRIIDLILAGLLALLWMDTRSIRKTLSLKKEPGKGRLTLKQIPVILLMTIAVLMIVGYSYLVSKFKDVSIDQLVFHMNTTLDGANWKDFSDLFHNLILFGSLAAGAGIATLILMFYLRRNPEKKHWKGRIISIFAIRWAEVVAALVAGSIVIDSFWWSYKVYDYMVNVNFDAEVFDDYYVDPKDVQLTFPEEKKNLIYIFMESMEISSADEASGGGKSFNAIPELTQLALENNDFNGDTGILNGAIPLTNGTWTIAGIVSQTSGLPLEIDHDMSNVRGTVTDFMPGATAIGDILEQQGYKNVFMLGSDAKFGNRTQYFTEHGDYEIDDLYWARREGLIPNDYYVWWGYEDKKLFTYARDEATKLAEGDQPFNLTLLTVDTHFTNGYLCEDCPDTYAQQYSNVIACSSKKVSEFVQWVQEQPWGKDTVIVLSGDHLCMDSKYYSDMPDGYERKTYVNIINGQKTKPLEKRTYATIDMFPTTLSALGVTIPGDRLGLGTDLYSKTPTLVEERGEAWMNTQFGMNSHFYNEKILYPAEPFASADASNKQ